MAMAANRAGNPFIPRVRQLKDWLKDFDENFCILTATDADVLKKATELLVCTTAILKNSYEIRITAENSAQFFALYDEITQLFKSINGEEDSDLLEPSQNPILQIALNAVKDILTKMEFKIKQMEHITALSKAIDGAFNDAKKIPLLRENITVVLGRLNTIKREIESFVVYDRAKDRLKGSLDEANSNEQIAIRQGVAVDDDGVPDSVADGAEVVNELQILLDAIDPIWNALEAQSIVQDAKVVVADEKKAPANDGLTIRLYDKNNKTIVLGLASARFYQQAPAALAAQRDDAFAVVVTKSPGKKQ